MQYNETFPVFIDLFTFLSSIRGFPDASENQVNENVAEVCYVIFVFNIISDELLLNFGAKFQRQFVISHVKLQNCHGNPSVRLSVKMAKKF